jgi:hypothetical protein
MTTDERNRVMTWTLRAIFALSLLAAASVTAYGQTQDDFFNDAVVQEVHLTVNTKDWQSLKENADQDTYYPTDFSWQGVTVHNVGIRSRGHVTRNGIKPGLRVDMNRYVSGQDFLGLKAVILKNVYDDPSFMHESVSMKMLARMGIAAPRELHARLYVNNVFVGLYVIVESVDRTFVERIFGPDEGSKDTGGYLYKYQKVSNYQFAYLGEDLAPYAQMFEPKTRETDSIVSLYGPLEEMIRVVNQTPDGQFLTAAGARIDLASAMKLLAVEDFMAEVDGFLGAWTMNNFYLYRGKNGVAQLIPWDTSQTFSSLAHPIDFDLLTNVLTIRSIAMPNLWQVYLNTLTKCAELASEVPEGDNIGWLEREIRNEVARIDPIVPEDPVAPFTPAQYHSAVDSMVQFAQLRSGFVACQVANAADPAGPQRDCAALLEPPQPPDAP